MAFIDHKPEEGVLGDGWDENMLIKSYGNCVKLVSEDIAKHLARSTNANEAANFETQSNTLNDFKVGDYVRATYGDDGCDYEAKIISIDDSNETCSVKYIGYENEETVNIKDLVPSWGKKSRRLQFQKANSQDEKGREGRQGKDFSGESFINFVPPPPPLPPMLLKNMNGSEHLSAMLMSWYMSGYYTGIYEGIKMSKETNGQKNC
ncbi:survival motor neuron protein [Ceratitis capitata]|uniref:Survival motor neuron protein n=1 Tax=Ceratitis capitata TaxID=7213 RepID=W8C296_CERCA|nr:survival motor neuron protein [Ceratitis capitata]